jgi:hypothetical protein
MRRIESIEASIVDVQMDRQRKSVDKEYKGLEEDTRQALAFQTHTVADTVALVGRYHARALRSYNSAYKILRELQRDRLKREALQPPAPLQLPTEPEKPAPEPSPNFTYEYEPSPSELPANIIVAASALHGASNSRMLR